VRICDLRPKKSPLYNRFSELAGTLDRCLLLHHKTHKKSHTGQTCDPNQSGRTATLLDRVHKTITYVGLPIMGRGEFALNLGFVN
jgi:hypothetical protein